MICLEIGFFYVNIIFRNKIINEWKIDRTAKRGDPHIDRKEIDPKYITLTQFQIQKSCDRP